MIARRLRAGWRRLVRGTEEPAATQVLGVADAYRLWSRSYAGETNELQALETELRAEISPPLHGCRVLDVGAGTGRVSAELHAAGAAVIAADLVLEMLRQAPSRAALAGRACVAHAAALPFRPQSFDVVVSALTLGHVVALDRALDAIVGVLRPGGSIVITDFHSSAMRRGWQRCFRCDGDTCAVQQYPHTLEEYERGLATRGCPVLASGERSWQGTDVLFGFRARRDPAHAVETPTDFASSRSISADP